MDLIEEAKRKLGTYRAVAQYLHIDESMISMVRAGKRPLPPYQAGKLAELLEINPAQAVVEAMVKAAEGKEEAANWKRWFARVAAITVAVFVVAGGSGLPTTTQAQPHPDQYANALLADSSMRPTSRRTVGRRNRFRPWQRGQAVDRDAGKRRHRRRRMLPRPCVPGRFRMLG